ncbi:MAG: DNA adenine methylase, partial [Panacagrimonas sp.]
FRWQQLSVPETLTDIQRAARFFYLQKLTFGGKVEGQTFGSATTSGPRFNLMRIEEDLSEAHLRLAETLVEHLPWDDCVVRYDRPHSLFYCDPPYWETEGYGVAFAIEEYVRLAELARSIAGTMIISVNDHPRMRDVFEGLEMRSVPITYTVGGGDKAAARHELIIGNWRGGWPEPPSLTAQLGIFGA